MKTEKKTICVKHKKSDCGESGWRYTTWATEDGMIRGWGCANVHYPEFVTDKIRDERVTYANDMLQSHRGGELSREFIEAHPKRAKQMLKDKAITKEEVKSAKYVWRGDVKGVKKKVDALELIK